MTPGGHIPLVFVRQSRMRQSAEDFNKPFKLKFYSNQSA
jgi:hypothetical protein